MFSGGRVINVLTDYIVDRGSHSEFDRDREKPDALQSGLQQREK